MPEFVYALHNFVPEHEDEIAFEAGQAIEVVEKDDQYNDGWWQGRNIAGKIGLFPQSYTTSAPPPAAVSTSSSASSTDPITTPPDSFTPEHESTSLINGDRDSKIGIAMDEPERADAEVMRATMTDVQKAIEQLGRSDRESAQSLSFSSTRDGDTDRETDGTETDGEVGEDWHRSARDKLAEQARKVVEAQAAEEAREAQALFHRTRAPPIDVELSDESEAEEDDAALQHMHHMQSTREHPHIPEEDEEEEARRKSIVSQKRKSATETLSVVPKDVPSSLEEETLPHTARANQLLFARPSSPPRSIRSPVPTTRRSSKSWSAATSPDAIGLAAPVPASPMGAQMIAKSASPEPGARATPTLSDIPAALPSPALTATAPRHHSRQTSMQNSISSTGKSSVTSAPETEVPTEVPDRLTPLQWSVDEVVDWLKLKGFGSDVYDKFIEQEITGDVLLELDLSLLKTEIGIIAFGKRMRIANAIAELRRPPSIILPDHHPQQAHMSLPSLYPHSPTGSAQYSLGSPMYTSMGSTLNGPASSTLAGPASFDSPRAEAFTTPLITKRVSSHSSASGGGSAEGVNAEKAPQGVLAGLGLQALPEAQLSPSPSESALVVPDTKPDEAPREDRGAQSEVGRGLRTSSVTDSWVTQGETAPVPKQSRRRLFGLSSDSSSKDKEQTTSESMRSADPLSVAATPRIKRSDSHDDDSVVARPGRTGRSLDISKSGSERHSLFVGAFTASIGRSRKPAPRVTSTLLEDSSPTEKSSSSSALARLYSSRKSSSRTVASDSSVVGSLKNGFRSNGSDEAKVERSKSLDKSRDSDKGSTPKVKPTELKEVEMSRKQTATPQAGSRGPNALKPGKSIIEQIGQPDHQGWMRKKGDHYNSWKLRYFIIKGPHLYILRSNSHAELKIKGYVNIVGYKVVADENIDPGRYGFRIVHDTDKTHFFSSDEQATVREWMKAIMKATIGRDYSKPVVSSVNIPTIPLTVAQAMNPAPRPPSPTARAATQKALRRDNPNQLSTRDARVLMGLPSADNGTRIDDGLDDERPRLDSFFANQSAEPSENGHGGGGTTPRNAKSAPPRPSREARRTNTSAQSLLDYGIDSNLVEWANLHLPRSLQVTDPAGPLFGGLALLRLAEDVMGKSATPPIPDTAFPTAANDDKLDGLFRLFDFLLDNDVKMGSVSINDVRQGKRDKVMQLLKALKSWQDRRKEIVKSLAQGPNHPVLLPVSGNSWR